MIEAITMSWKKVTLTTEQIEEERALIKLEDEFEQLFMQADGPSDMALFSDNEYEGDKITIYFTPGCLPSCEALVSRCAGVDCDAPSRGGVFLFAGNDDACDLLA